MQKVELYTTPICGYCAAAKRLLKSKSVSFAEIDVMSNPAKKPEMIKRANGGRTVPQIFIGGKHIGGFDDLNLLNQQGKLDALLAG
ncbi:MULTISPECIES: glutaredoxin 3 [Rhodobacterales]|uniref:glutaredoxin 3 n=1 Tax=Roseobacter sp. N2S TaxID=2663844 RepID=UPI0028571446|nr:MULTISPECIES: glutaredoxin 3 [Rhodobacterales]MDR6263351.1 glutaredoxin 3 [Roseobacter sp. N2S]